MTSTSLVDAAPVAPSNSAANASRPSWAPMTHALAAATENSRIERIASSFAGMT